jgi:hypothetical protein
VWGLLKKGAFMTAGLRNAGFTGGWLAPQARVEPASVEREQARPGESEVIRASISG